MVRQRHHDLLAENRPPGVDVLVEGELDVVERLDIRGGAAKRIDGEPDQPIQLVGLEIEQLVSNYGKLLGQIEEYEAILSDEQRVRQLIRDDLLDLKHKYGDERRTVIEEGEVGELDIGALTPEMQVVVTISHHGYIKRLPVEEYRVQGRGGKGLITMNRTKRTGPLVTIKGVHEGNDLMIITENGIMIRMSVDEISQMGRNTQGVRVINLKGDDSIADVTRVVTEEDEDEASESAEASEASEAPVATNGQPSE